MRCRSRYPCWSPTSLRTVHRVIRDLPEPLRAQAKEYARQEAVHGSRHRAFNAALRTQWPVVSHCEGATAFLTRRIEAMPGTRFHTGFAAGFEAVAFEVARWCAPRLDALLDGADDETAALFVWHLAEESEHAASHWTSTARSEDDGERTRSDWRCRSRCSRSPPG